MQISGKNTVPAAQPGCEQLQVILQLENKTNETVLKHQIREDVPFIKKTAVHSLHLA